MGPKMVHVPVPGCYVSLGLQQAATRLSPQQSVQAGPGQHTAGLSTPQLRPKKEAPEGENLRPRGAAISAQRLTEWGLPHVGA